MSVRGVGRAIAGLALIAAVSACDDNPLAEDRETGEYFRLSSSNAVVNVGDTITVVANVLNKFGAALIVNVTAVECDASVSVQPDTARSEFEAPEQFRIAGNSAGQSCVVVSGGGVTDTIHVRVVPASIAVTAPPGTVGSGETVALSVAFLGAFGATAPGVSFDPSTTSFVVRNSAAGSINANGEFFAQAPGTTWIVATYADLGVTRSDSLQIEVVPGTFNGTVTVLPYGAASLVVQLDEGSIPFDADTYVALADDPAATDLADISTATSTLLALIPAGTAAGEDVTYFILNVGPNNVTLEATATATSDVAVDNTSDAGAGPLDLDEIGFGLIPGERGAEVWYVVNVTVAGTYRIRFGWGDNLDKDAYVLDSGFNTLLALEAGAATNPETGTVTIAPGTYYLVGATWTPNPGDPATYRMSFTLEN